MRRVAAGQRIAGIVHHFHTNRNMAHAYAEVDERLPCSGRIPGVHVIGSHFQFERSGHAVVRLKFVVPRFLSVFVEVNESRGDYKAFGIDGGRALQCFVREGGDLAVFYGNVPDRIQSRLGVHHASVQNHNVVGLGGG